jgi:hypothetical protein
MSGFEKTTLSLSYNWVAINNVSKLVQISHKITLKTKKPAFPYRLDRSSIDNDQIKVSPF